jgi:hypothetical protein
MGAGPGLLPSAFICAICGSFPAGRAGGGPGAFKVQRFKVQRFRRSKAPCLPVFPSSLFKGINPFAVGSNGLIEILAFSGSQAAERTLQMVLGI